MVIQPAVIYRSETFTMKKADTQKRHVTEVKILLRWLNGMTRKDRIKSKSSSEMSSLNPTEVGPIGFSGVTTLREQKTRSRWELRKVFRFTANQERNNWYKN